MIIGTGLAAKVGLATDLSKYEVKPWFSHPITPFTWHPNGQMEYFICQQDGTDVQVSEEEYQRRTSIPMCPDPSAHKIK